MATEDDVRRIALALPATTEDPNSLRFFVDGRAFAWSWLERVDPERARVPNRDVLAILVGDEPEKETLIEMDPQVFFTEPHYDGYPAILVRIPVIDVDLLRRVLTDAWRCRASRRLVAELPARGRR